MNICNNCGEMFSNDMTVCPNCGAPVSNKTEKTVDQNIESSVYLLLDNYADLKTPIIIRTDGVIARETSTYEPDFFAKLDYVSQPHCSFERCGNIWKITDLDSTNGTRVNGVDLAPGIAKELHDGDVIKVATILTFKVHECQDLLETEDVKVKPETAKEFIINEDTEERWVVFCPNTLKAYPVAGPDDIIKICECCSDLFDREKIAGVRAKRIMVKKHANR